MREMTDNGARFLKLDKTTKEWYAVGRKAVIEKVRTKEEPLSLLILSYSL